MAAAEEQRTVETTEVKWEPITHRRHSWVQWRELLLSRWAPACVLVVALIPYVILVHYRPESSHWALPLIQGFTKLMFAWFVGLLLWPLVARKQYQMFRARRHAREAQASVTLAAARKGSKKAGVPRPLDSTGRTQLDARLQALDAALAAQDPKAVEAETQRLTEFAQQQQLIGRESNTGALLSFGKALAIALLIRMVLVEPYRIPSGSMLPTLEVGDFVFISKFIYGVRVPFINKVPFVIVREPERGDVIVFDNPVTDQDFIKRVVGVAGDRVELRNGNTYINGEPVPRELTERDFVTMDRLPDGEWHSNQSIAFREQLGDHVFTTLKLGEVGRCHSEGPYVVPEGHVFVMGDNRDNSLDSRYGLGRGGGGLGCDPSQVEYVPLGNIKGKALIVWLSFAHDGLGSDLFGGAGFRMDRLFLRVP